MANVVGCSCHLLPGHLPLPSGCTRAKPVWGRTGKLLRCRDLDGKAPGGLETARRKTLTKSVCGDLGEAGGEGEGEGKGKRMVGQQAKRHLPPQAKSKGANEAHQIEWLTLSQLEHRRSFQLLTSMPFSF